MKTTKGIGFGTINTNIRPTHYIEKFYPINGRTDFFKLVIVTPDGLATDYKGDIMYFDEFRRAYAIKTLKAIKITSKF
jgi:hypothetical protein